MLNQGVGVGSGNAARLQVVQVEVNLLNSGYFRADNCQPFIIAAGICLYFFGLRTSFKATVAFLHLYGSATIYYHIVTPFVNVS